MMLAECTGLTKNYGSKPALRDVGLSIESGKIIGLLGPNGSGKTTLIKMMSGLLSPTYGEVKICGNGIGVETKKVVSYLPERTYLNPAMKVSETVGMFKDFYEDFNPETAYGMLQRLNINPDDRFRTLSKGTREKVQLVLVMSRNAKLFLLDEPIGGVDPAARDYILNTIISNYNEDASIIISTHLISDVEKVLDEVIFIKEGVITLHSSVDDIRAEHGKSADALFREVFAC